MSDNVYRYNNLCVGKAEFYRILHLYCFRYDLDEQAAIERIKTKGKFYYKSTGFYITQCVTGNKRIPKAKKHYNRYEVIK